MQDRQRGEGKLGCMITLVLLGLFVFASVKVVPVYLSKIEFGEDFSRIVSQAGAKELTASYLRKNVERIANLYEFEIVPNSIKHRRKQFHTGPSQIIIEVTVYKDVEFPGYTHRFHYRFSESSYVGSL